MDDVGFQAGSYMYVYVRGQPFLKNKTLYIIGNTWTLGPPCILFNIFLNDLFYHIKDVYLHAYADDEQLYDSDVDPRAFEQWILDQVQFANQWYTENSMITNPDKHHAVVLGTTDHRFSFPVGLPRLAWSHHWQSLNFNKHVSLACKKVNNQLNAMIRFHNLICTATKLKLYNAFILPHVLYCSMVWHFCSTKNCDKLESLNKHVLRIVLSAVTA